MGPGVVVCGNFVARRYGKLSLKERLEEKAASNVFSKLVVVLLFSSTINAHRPPCSLLLNLLLEEKAGAAGLHCCACLYLAQLVPPSPPSIPPPSPPPSPPIPPIPPSPPPPPPSPPMVFYPKLAFFVNTVLALLSISIDSH